MDIDWEAELAGLLTELSAAQEELLAFLDEKRRLLATVDMVRLSALQDRERQLIARLQGCHDRRGELLARAATHGRPHSNLRSLASSLPHKEQAPLAAQVDSAAARARLLQNQGLTNWVLAQRTLIHLSQLLEIIGTGGRSSPTYGKGEPQHASGALVDRAA